MRILINGVSAVAGGGITYLRNLAELLPRLAPQHHFVFALPEGLALPFSGDSCEVLPIEEAHLGVLARLTWENFQLWQICRDRHIDLLFCPANLVPFLKPRIPVVGMVRNVAPFYPRVRRLLFRYEGAWKGLHMLALEVLTRLAVLRADYVLYLSQATRKLIEKAVARVPSSVLYHGVNPHFFPRPDRPVGAPAGDFFISVSNIYVYKGMEFLIQAYRAFPDLPPVCIIGKPLDLGYYQAMEQEIREAGLTERVRFLGDVPYRDLPWWYSCARAMVYTSWCENCPNILLEAMACGCPIVAMATGPMPEICGSAAVYARPFHGQSLGEAMRLVLDPDRSQSLRQAGITRAGEFSRETSVQQLLAAFEQAVALSR